MQRERCTKMEKYLAKQRVMWICGMDFTFLPTGTGGAAPAATTSVPLSIPLPKHLKWNVFSWRL